MSVFKKFFFVVNKRLNYQPDNEICLIFVPTLRANPLNQKWKKNSMDTSIGSEAITNRGTDKTIIE